MNRKSILTGFLRLILLSILLASSCSESSHATAPIDDWPMFQHDSAHTGATASAGPTESVELWRFPVGNDVFSSAAVVNGVVYVGGNDNIYALNAYTGAKIWNYTTTPMIYSSPAVSGGKLFIGTDGNVLALDASSGTEVWSYPTGGRVISSPAVVDGVVYVGSPEGNLYALNASTGEKIWNHTAGLIVTSAPAVCEGAVYVSSSNGYLYALNVATSEEIWNFTVSDLLQRLKDYSPTVADGVVYIRSSDLGELYAVDALTGDLKWENQGSFNVRGSAAISDGVVYSGTSALNASTGEEIWHFPTDGDKVYASPAVSNGVLYVASGDGNFYAIGKPLTVPSPSPNPNPSILTAWIVTAIALLTVFGIALRVYFKKRKHQNTVNICSLSLSKQLYYI